MFLLGLLLPICFWAGYTGFALPTQWALLSCLLPLSLWRSGPWTLLHWLGVLFLAYAVLSLRWTLNIYDGLGGVWLISFWALGFWLGSTLPSLAGFFRGLALGLALNTGVALAQWLGYHPVFTMPENYAGLLFNQTVVGAIIGLTIIGLVCYRQWVYIPALLPGLWLAHSRGGYLIIGVGLLARYINPTIAIGLLALAALPIAFGHIDLSDSYRLQVWHLAIKNINLLGWGPGSFFSLIMFTHGTAIHPEFAHNDYIQLLFEFGVGGLLPIAILAIAACIRSPERPIILAFCALAAVYFPLQHAMVAVVGALAAGCASRCLDLSWATRYLSRLAILSRASHKRHPLAINRGQPVPL